MPLPAGWVTVGTLDTCPVAVDNETVAVPPPGGGGGAVEGMCGEWGGGRGHTVKPKDHLTSTSKALFRSKINAIQFGSLLGIIHKQNKEMQQTQSLHSPSFFELHPAPRCLMVPLPTRSCWQYELASPSKGEWSSDGDGLCMTDLASSVLLLLNLLCCEMGSTMSTCGRRADFSP